MLFGNPFILFSIFKWIDKNEVFELEVNEQQLYFIISLIALITLFFIFKPLMKLIIGLKWYHFLTYIVTILAFVNILWLINQVKFFSVFESHAVYALLSIIVLGIIVVITQFTKIILSYWKNT
ncbi:hypothetical protein Pryu01_02305 [Paraliobacillus ryukyuensis]|uniref:Uncharacterized protein n=1 Tax=Paraliobacillus ryukyuensis TaxID=200904 RepID=A0A366DWN4_9BACI|nr:hypothetical protein [Paraliobacillus ryukyuensis]RBO94521.1 hypothetical protein DES48_1106 [Paraliobacillus ryukyuensis]